MPTGDGWLVRLKPPAARLTAAAAASLADESLAGGNGMVQVTQRGNLQFRGFSPASAAAFAATAVASGVAARDPRAERNRRVMAAPLGSESLPLAVESWLADFVLPEKFCVLVDDADFLRLEDISADIAIRVESNLVRLSLGGAPFIAQCTPAELPDKLRRILAAFIDLSDGEARMADLISDFGEAMFFAAAGLVPVREEKRWVASATHPTVGVLSDGVVGLALPYGLMRAEGLAALADCARDCADGKLRTTPWRTFVFAGVTNPGRLIEMATSLGLITDPADPRLSIVACPGRPACASALADTHEIADLMARRAHKNVHVSGCAKGCAHPGPAAITLVGTTSGVALVRDGRAGDPAHAMLHEFSA
jgi:precorrin-3B synthase